jgi:hypothetical protein
MSELKIQNIHPFENNTNERSFILIQNTDQIPPHISLEVDGNYFSVSVSGVKTEVDFQSVLKNIQVKKIPCLILEISKIKFSSQAIADIFNHYGRLDKPEKSCLFPIIDLLNRAYGLIHESEFVFELIQELKRNENLLSVFHLNLESKLKEDSFLFPTYQREDIRFCIDKLNDKQHA